MQDIKIVSVLGKEYGDLPYYLARMIEEKKYRTLVIDNSSSHDLFLSLKRADEDADYVEHGCTVYMRNKTATKEDLGAFVKFDVVIVYHGLNEDKELIDMSDLVIIQTDYLPSTLRLINDYIDMEYINETVPKDAVGVVYRDKVNNKISEQYVLKELGLNGIEMEYYIPLDEGTYASYLNFCHNGIQNIKGVCSEMKSTITSLRVMLVGKSNKKTEKEEVEDKPDKKKDGKRKKGGIL